MKNKISEIVLIAAIIWQTILYFRLPSFIWEDAFVIPWFLSRGLTFYKDFSGGSYFPLPKLIMVSVNSLFGWNVHTTIILSYLLAISAILLIYFISPKYLKGIYKTIPLIFFSIWFGFILKQNTFEINLFLGLLILANIHLLFGWMARPKAKISFLMGIVSSVAVSSQQMTIVSMGLILIIMTVFAISKHPKPKNIILKTIFPYTIGFSIIPIFMFIWFYSKGLIGEFYYWNVLYYFQGGGYPFNKYFSPSDIIMLAFLCIPFFLLIFRMFSKKNISWQTSTIGLSIFTSIILILIAVLHPRRYLYILPTLSLVAGIEFQFLCQSKKRLAKIGLILISIIFGIYSLTTIIPWYTKAIVKGRTYEIQNIHHPGDYVYEAIEWIKKNTTPEDKVFSFETMIAYFEMQRLPAINRTYILPWAFEPFSETEALWNKTLPKYAFVSELMFKRFKDLGYEKEIQFLRNSLDEKYLKTAVFGWMSIYVKK